MRKRQTFLLTVLTPDNGTSSFCGRVKVISTGKTSSFANLEEFYCLIASEMTEEKIQHIAGQDQASGCTDKTVLSP